MKQERLMKVLAGPVISEKSTLVAEKHRQYTFRVVADATKPEVKAAVELLFKVKVDGVQILTTKGKVKQRGGRIGGCQQRCCHFICLFGVGHSLAYVC